MANFDDMKNKKKKSTQSTPGINPVLAEKFKEKADEVKKKLQEERLQHKIRQHTISPLKAIIPSISILLIIVYVAVFFSKKAEKIVGGIDAATAPKIKAEGEKAGIPENSALPVHLKAVENSFYTATPDHALFKGGHNSVQEQKKAVSQFKLPVEIENEVGMRFRLIPPGSFIMGSPKNEEFREEDEFQHLKKIKVPFYVGKTEVSVEQWRKIMGNIPHNSLKEPSLPVTGISLNDALIFVQQLNRQLPIAAGFKYFIISEDEWEYSCRAGTEASYFFGHYSLASDYATYKRSTSTHNVEPVGQRRPNPWGLYDMLGNAMEWTRTPYFIYACGEDQYAGIDAATAKKRAKDIVEFSWDTPVYDGEHPENLIDRFDQFDVPMRSLGTNLDICYHDKNNNKTYDNHEAIWKDNLSQGNANIYDPEFDIPILTFSATPDKAIAAGTKGEKEGLYYYDKNLSTEWDPGESIWARNDKNRKNHVNYCMRGGSYFFDVEDLRSASRFNLPRQNAPSYTGLRVVIYLDRFLRKD